MSIIFTSPKGGNGTTVTATAHALLSAHRNVRTVLVDLCGDVPATLGISEPTGEGANDWLSESSAAAPSALIACGVEVEPNLLVVPRGRVFIDGEPRWDALARLIAESPHHVVIDAGLAALPAPVFSAHATLATVVRPCYLTLRRSVSLPRPVTAYIVNEEGRALTVNDVVHVLGAAEHTVVPHSAAIARAVDAGLLSSRVDRLFGDHLRTPSHG